jgi:hypothetical protein
MNELGTVNSSVPANIQDVAKEVLIGRDRLDAIRAAINAAKKLNKQTYEAMKAEGREYGERILDCELKLAEYFRSLPKATKYNNPSGKGGTQSDTDVVLGKTQAVNELGFEAKEAQRIQELTRHAVEKAKVIARENNDIPTRSLALQIAKQDKKEAEPEKPLNKDDFVDWDFVYKSRLSYANKNEDVAEVIEMANDFEDDEGRIEFLDDLEKMVKRVKREWKAYA